MWFFTLVTWLAYIVQILFFTLSLAAGLYYLAELVEEYTNVAGRIIRYLILLSLFLYIGFWLFESFPLSIVGCGIASQVLSLALMKSFPVFSPTSPSFVGVCVLVVLNHYLTFKHFVESYTPFPQVLAFFTLCLWLVPFAFFVSLSTSDQVLPTFSQKTHLSSTELTNADSTDVVSNYFMKKQKYRSGLMSMFQKTKDFLLPSQTKRFS